MHWLVGQTWKHSSLSKGQDHDHGFHKHWKVFIITITMKDLIHTHPLSHIWYICTFLGHVSRCSSPPFPCSIWYTQLSWSRFQRMMIYIPPHHEPQSGLKMWDDFSHIQCMSHFELQWTQVKWLKFDSNFGLANLFTDNTRWQSWANSLESYHCVKCSNAKCSMFKMEMLGGRVYQCVKWGDMQNSRNNICPHSYICHKLSQVIALHLCFLNTQSILFQDVWCKCFPKIS